MQRDRGDMNDSACLARTALRTDLHLACVEGPDVGLVIAPGTVGRAGQVPLACSSIAREHATFSTRAGRAHLRTATGASPIQVCTRLGLWRRLHRKNQLAPGRRLRVGADTFEVRSRPWTLAWPGVDRRGRATSPGAAFLRGAPLVSFLVMASLMVWRLRSVPVSPRVLWTLGGVIGVLACVCVLAVLRRVHRRKRGWDGAALALVLASLPTASVPPRERSVAVWPGRATWLRRRVALSAPSSSSRPDDAASLGIAGSHGAECALWCAGQVAAQMGGARVWWNHRSPVLLGAQAVDIHVTDRETCPSCARGNSNEKSIAVLHIGYASHIADLPSWCARVCVSDELPVSPRWWWTVTRTTNQDCLPKRVDWDPHASVGTVGSLSVVIGHAQSGPVALDLVSDGPHALVAGCTGSGKSEALLGWLASIAHCYSPERVRFILIDYKGGSTFARLADLPHTQALLTDLDAGATARALDGIASVLRSREATLADMGLPDLASWERAHDTAPDTVAAPPPRLIVAIDEFRVLADTHPSSMDVLLRLAAQGRSLGLHLIAATQRPSGAINASMRANMDIRLALRCVSAADSTDILGDCRASALPRVPGRAVLAGVGTLQLTYMADVARVVDGCGKRWPRACSAPLWAPALPDTLSWEDIDEAFAGVSVDTALTHHAAASSHDCGMNGPDALALGLVEGIESHSALVWDGGSIQIQTSAHEGSLAARWVLAIATRIAGAIDVPLHVIAEEDAVGASSLLSASDVGAIDLLQGVCENGPAVLAITDVSALRSNLAEGLSIPQAEELWASLLGRARRAGIVIVAAYAGRFTSSTSAMGAFSMRLVRAREANEALHAGLSPSDLRSLASGQALLVRPGEPTVLACIPMEMTPLQPRQSARSLSGARAWRIPSAKELASLVSNSSMPALIGPEYAPSQWLCDKPWIVIGSDSGVQVLTDLHDALGWNPPTIVDVIPEAAWTRITRWDGLRVLALNPSDNVIRALIRSSHTYPLSIVARRWSPSCGLVCEGGTLTTIQLTIGSVTT